jgi:hypothetical protein
MTATLNDIIHTSRTAANAMPAKTDSLWGTAMSLILVMATTLKNLVWKKRSKNTWTATKGENPQVMTSFEKEIISKLCKYIDGVITIKEFSDWFVPTTWALHIHDSTYSSKLVYSIKMHFAAYGSGHYTKEELRERLIDLIL